MILPIVEATWPVDNYVYIWLFEGITDLYI